MKHIEIIDRKTGLMFRENPPNERFLRFLFHHPLGKLPLHLLVRRKLMSVWAGNQMNKLKSVSRIAPFVKTFHIDMTEAENAITDFKHFNDFFYRKLKKASRPISEGLISPADGKILAFEHIDDSKDFFIKGNKFTLSRFLKNDTLASEFKDATLIIIRLAPNDYHRFHFPYQGHISETNAISGTYYSVSPYAVKENFTIFCENKRTYSLLKTEDKGTILLSEIGATMVGSIFQTYTPNKIVSKGDEKGYFAFGGSTVLMLVPAQQIKIAKDILENTKKGFETTIKMGENIGF
jgi:phosphatidylserine decarboxylase